MMNIKYCLKFKKLLVFDLILSGWSCTVLTQAPTQGLCGQCGGILNLWLLKIKAESKKIWILLRFILFIGTGYTGVTTCVSGATCYYVAQYGYSLCLSSCPSGKIKCVLELSRLILLKFQDGRVRHHQDSRKNIIWC